LHFRSAKENMSEFQKYIQLKSTQVLIPNQLNVDTIFLFFFCNLLIITILALYLAGIENDDFLFFELFKASEF